MEYRYYISAYYSSLPVFDRYEGIFFPSYHAACDQLTKDGYRLSNDMISTPINRLIISCHAVTDNNEHAGAYPNIYLYY